MNGTRPDAGPVLATAAVQAGEWVRSNWEARAEADRVVSTLDRFGSFCSAGFGLELLVEVTPEVAAAFVGAPAADGGEASVSLRHLRRLSVRLLFRVARSAGAAVGDPTLDLRLPPRTPFQTRPLTDDEVLLGRGAAQWSLSDTRRLAAWALAEATARTSELPHIQVSDLDLEAGRVFLHGGKRVGERWGALTSWGLEQLRVRLRVIGNEPDLPILYRGSDPRGAGQVAAATVLQDVLVRAGLAEEPDMRASSVAAWAGRRVLEETGRIDLAAQALGVRSLDRAARIIGWDWTEHNNP
jgi:integrase/recombinase XerC